MLPKIFKTKTNDVVRAIAPTKAGEAEFFDFGGLHAQLKEIHDPVMLIEGDLGEEQIEAKLPKSSFPLNLPTEFLYPYSN